MNTQDFVDHGARDRAVRVQTYSPVRRLDGVPAELFAHYWRDVHGPLCARLPGLGFYVQHHFSRDRRANLWPHVPGTERIDVVLDGAVEIGFAGNDDMDRFVTASPILFGDEINCFGWDAAFFVPEGSTTFVDHQADGRPNGPDRLHRLHVYMSPRQEAGFRAWATQLAGSYASAPQVRKLRLHLPERFDNANPQPPSPVDHHVPDEMLSLAVMEIGFDSALAARQFFEAKTYAASVDGLTSNVQAMNAFLVTGVYTFVRDGAPTMAGLRGSRAAEIIDQIGATNHWDKAVTDLFTRG